MKFRIIPTPPFERELKQLAKKYSSIRNDITALGATLLDNPQTGVPLGNECYKIRMVISSKAKASPAAPELLLMCKSFSSTFSFYLSSINQIWKTYLIKN